jgi:uncharacterized protein YecT (DUF1311 family)
VQYGPNGPLPPPPPPPPPPAPPVESPSATAQQEGDPGTNQAAKGHPIGARYLSEDDDTKFVRIALRWIFVRQQANSIGLFWADVTRSFKKAIGRKFATGKRKMGSLEDQWRAKFAARDAESGLQGNNNSDLARAMRAWLAFRDEEELAKREKEDDMRALDVRRERLHELETERLKRVLRQN